MTIAGTSGTFSYNFTIDEIWEKNARIYHLYIEAKDPQTNENATLMYRFRVFGHQEKYFCTQNMINSGTRPIPQGGVVEFISVGNSTDFICTISNEEITDTLPCK